MATKLETLLADIDPARTIDVVESRINGALARYHQNKNTVDSTEAFERCLADFEQIARNAALNLPRGTAVNLKLNFQQALRYLERDYPQRTYQAVYNIMSSGAEGGILAISRKLARRMAEHFAENEINGRVQVYWASLSTDEKLAAADDYIQLYKDILPHNSLQDVIRLKANFPEVLQNHPPMIKRLRDLQR
jgi:hypothetical protein